MLKNDCTTLIDIIDFIIYIIIYLSDQLDLWYLRVMKENQNTAIKKHDSSKSHFP